MALIAQFSPLGRENVPLSSVRGRVLAQDAAPGEDVPPFDRSSMDGYGVRARDTFGSSEGLPGLFQVMGEVRMGVCPDLEISSGQTARIWTGGMLPPGADAVVMVEYSRKVDNGLVELTRPVTPFENVIRKGEDVKEGEILVKRGTRLRPQDLGLLAELGWEQVPVFRIPRVAVISTGDEIVPVGQTPRFGQIRDVNTYTLSALVEEAHAEPIMIGLVKDDPEALRQAVERAGTLADIVILSGGSSVGVRDYTLDVLGGFPGSEILVHGVSVSPGKPTIMARIGNQSFWGLPGHTVSAMITCDLFIRPLIDILSGRKVEKKSWSGRTKAVLARNVPSVHGREDYVRLWLEESPEGPVAYPILGKSGLISTMVKADGLMKIGLHEEGRLKGDQVEVLLFGRH